MKDVDKKKALVDMIFKDIEGKVVCYCKPIKDCHFCQEDKRLMKKLKKKYYEDIDLGLI